MNSQSGTKAAAGIWAMIDGVPAALESWDVGAATVLVPAEQVLMLAVDLPLAGRSRRLAALPFAVEDRIAEPLDRVHVALGHEIAPRVHLAGVVRHAVMAGWVAALDAAGLGHAAIVPDAMLLPPPPAGAWAVEAAGARIAVRTDGGTAFAAPLDAFTTMWHAGGRLPCIVHGAPLPFDLPLSVPATFAEPAARRLAPPPLDLRQGPYAAAARPLPAAVRRLGVVLAAGLLAHTAVAAADTVKLRAVAAERQAETAALVRRVLPGLPPGADVERLLPGPRRDPFLPLLARTAAALAPVGGLKFDKLGYAGDGALTLGIEAADIGGLQRAEAALAAAGLSPVGGAATAGTGRADGEIVVRGAAA